MLHTGIVKKNKQKQLKTTKPKLIQLFSLYLSMSQKPHSLGHLLIK